MENLVIGLKKNGIPKTEASRVIKIADKIPNSVMSQNIGVNALYLMATLLEAEK